MSDNNGLRQRLLDHLANLRGHLTIDSVAEALLPFIRAAINTGIANELESIAASYDQWHQEAVETIKAGGHSHKGIVRSYAVRDQLLEIAESHRSQTVIR
jgi:hypothetical protein